jgi:hypothetical protein
MNGRRFPSPWCSPCPAALGGWTSGIIFDHTGSYRVAFLNGLIWNVVNAVIVVWLLLRPTQRLAAA